MRDVVLVLHAGDLADQPSFCDLRGGDVAQSDVAHQTLTLQIGQHRDRRLDRALGRTVVAMVVAEHRPEVHDVEHLEAEVAEVVMNRLRQLLPREGRVPGLVLAAQGADLGDDHEAFGVGVERLADQLVGEVRAVEVAGVDVVDAARDRLAQHRQGGVTVPGRSEHAGPSELHGAIAEAVHRAIAEGERA